MEADSEARLIGTMQATMITLIAGWRIVPTGSLESAQPGIANAVRRAFDEEQGSIYPDTQKPPTRFAHLYHPNRI
jgi:hypothetical protein